MTVERIAEQLVFYRDRLEQRMQMGQFYKLAHFFRPDSEHYWVIIRTLVPIIHDRITLIPNNNITYIGNMYSTVANGIPFGYLFEIPNNHFHVLPNHVVMYRQAGISHTPKLFRNVQILLQTDILIAATPPDNNCVQLIVSRSEPIMFTR